MENKQYSLDRETREVLIGVVSDCIARHDRERQKLLCILTKLRKENEANKIQDGLRETLADTEKERIRATLNKVDWNIARAAESLGIHRNTLTYKIRDYKISRA